MAAQECVLRKCGGGKHGAAAQECASRILAELAKKIFKFFLRVRSPFAGLSVL
jgi:hypothetical protein